MPESRSAVSRYLCRLEERAKRNLMKFNNNKYQVSPWDRTAPPTMDTPPWQCLRTDCLWSGPSGRGLGGLTAGGEQIEHESAACSCRDEGQLHTAFHAGGGKWIFPPLGTYGATAGSCLLFWAASTRERSAKCPESGGGHQGCQGAGALGA